MKKLLLIFLLLVSLSSAKAQDKTIAINQDTIALHTTPEIHEHRWLFSLQGGLSYSLTDYSGFANLVQGMENASTETDKYIDQLKNGYHFNASLHYLMNDFLGLGIDYNFFTATSKGKFLSRGYGDLSVPVYASLDLDERLYVNFIGLSVIFQQFPDKRKRIKITETISPGYLFFRDETRSNEFRDYWGEGGIFYGEQYYDHSNSMLEGKSIGAKGGLSIEYGITPQLSAGLAGNFTWGQLHKVSIRAIKNNHSGVELDKAMNISHVDYGFSIRYKF